MWLAGNVQFTIVFNLAVCPDKKTLAHEIKKINSIQYLHSKNEQKQWKH